MRHLSYNSFLGKKKITLFSIIFSPTFAFRDPAQTAVGSKGAPQPLAPVEGLRHGIVGGVPARVLQEGEGDAGVDWVLGVGARHGFVLWGGKNRVF